MRIITFILFLLQIITINAQQKLLKQVDNRIVYEKFDSITKQARIKHYEIKPKKNRLYYWYWKSSFQKNYGGFEGSLLDGDYIVFDKEENLLEKAKFKKGIIRGKYLYWDKKGTLIKEERWRCGIKTGRYKIYNSNGLIVEKGCNLRGKKQGIVSYYIDGKKYKKKKYNKGLEMKDLTALRNERQQKALDKKQESKSKDKEKKEKHSEQKNLDKKDHKNLLKNLFKKK